MTAVYPVGGTVMYILIREEMNIFWHLSWQTLSRVSGLITATTALKSTVKYEIWGQRGKVTCRRSHSTKRQNWGLTQACLTPVPLLLSLSMVALDSIHVFPPINTVMVPQGE